MTKLVIFGSGSHAKVVLSEILKLKKFKFIGFIDDYKKKGEFITNFNKKNYYNLGCIKDVIKKNNNFRGIVGVGLNFIRKKIVTDINKINKNFKFQKIISKDAIINANVNIDDGSLIMSGTVINCGTIIGKHCLLNTSSSIDHDNFFGDYSGTGPGTITGGHVEVGELSYIGLGSIIKHEIKIAENTVIGFGSLIAKNCKKNSIYWGSPAKKIRSRKYDESYL
tara:strand:- start:221 stop:889 length:669 start_codon:yes stop_codon:yes gene_type:complete